MSVTTITTITTIDCHYMNRPGMAAAYLLREGDRAAFIETNTLHAVPHLLAALDAEGLRPEQVDYIIITHVHLDHAGGASALMEHCPNATLLAHPRALPHALDPTKLVASAKQVYGEAEFAEMYGEIGSIDADRGRSMQDGETLEWGDRTLTFLHTRGHANHHFCVQDSGSNAIFTGDAFGLCLPSIGARGCLVMASTTPTDFDAAEAKLSVDRILNSGAKRAYLTHFDGHDNLAEMAGAMHEQLDAYALVVNDAEGQAVADDALDAFCLGRVQAIFDAAIKRAQPDDQAQAQELFAFDAELNAQGIAFAIRRARRKR